MKRLLPLIYIMVCAMCTSCLTEDVPANTARGNLQALWTTLDEHYCFFREKEAEFGVDWDEVRLRYEAELPSCVTYLDFFELLSRMTYELRDGHVNLIGSHNTSRYGAWFDDYPTNFADTLERRYLGTATEYYSTCGMKYRYLPGDSVAYIRISSFESGIGTGNLANVCALLERAPGLIVDIRSNGGGLLTTATDLAGLFVEKTTVGGYIRHKRGAAHDDFSSPEAIDIKPAKYRRWTKPVCILTNRRTYSAANAFVMFLKGLDGITVVGDRTGGGAGIPFNSELPIGWGIRFSACPMSDRNDVSAESGIEPDVAVSLLDEDVLRGEDTIIEAARRILLGKANGEEEGAR